ncbi:aminopeptidase N-like [Palaemon carinicauda]|uniref:aminopeptidase N-like n=1 Tax=Palaemon carinicauda TaxID=392227 RepID=UPI0035B5E1A9
MGGTKKNCMEPLNMDMNHPDNNISFSNKKGCYISRLAIFFLFVLFLCSVAATGFLVFYYHSEVKFAFEEVKEYLGLMGQSKDYTLEEKTNLISSTTMKMLTEDPGRVFPDLSSTVAYSEPEDDVNIVDFVPVTDEHYLDSSTETNTEIPLDEVGEKSPSASSSEVEAETLAHDIEMVQPELSSIISSSFSPEVDRRSLRLPRALKPVHYLIRLQPFVNGNFSVRGYLEVEIEVLEETSNVTLHIADIITHNETVILRKLQDFGNLETLVQRHEFDAKREFYIAHLSQPLEKGSRHLMSMEFEGYLNDNMKGFYRSTYEDADGSQKFLAATQFQASDARRAFPCFDEPGFKATFEIYLAREEAMTTISNMPIVETTPMFDQDGWVWDRYNTTIPMSSYLVAFAVSDFASMNETNENWMFRVWARESALDQAEYALSIGPKMLSHFEEFFKIPFPLPKLDMIALPDFAPGAMENWGLVTFRETLMLYHPSTSSAYNKQLIASVTSHELAHQWFGNLVTPQWWTDIWLNEGFASYVEYIGVDHVEPSFQMMEQFVLERIHRIFQMDSLESSHPIRHDAENADMIAYDKGSSVIRMMNHFLSDATFTRGLNNYLRAFQYANAEQDDLWHHLTVAAHEDQSLSSNLTVKTIMDTWTLQMGYPVVMVLRSPDGVMATVTQERFLQVPPRSQNSQVVGSHSYRWWVPLTYTGRDSSDFTSTKPRSWMSPSNDAITLRGLPPHDQWVIFNIQQTGFYRVNYDVNNWKLIINQLMANHSVIGTINRAQIIDDSLNLAKAGHLPYAAPLSILRYLVAEEDYVPWAAALNNLSYLKRMFRSTPEYEVLRKYLLSIILPLYESVGFEDSTDDPLLSQYKRQKGLAWACMLEHHDCLNKSVELYRMWMAHPKNNSIVSPNLKSMVYCRGIQEGGEKEWQFAWQQYLLSNVGSEKEQLLSAMGCTRNQQILLRYLEMAFTTDSGIRKQDTKRVFRAVASNPVGTSMAWNFIQENWNVIYDFFDKIVIDLIKASTKDFNNAQDLQQVHVFVEQHASQLLEHKLDVQQLLENVHNNLSWMNNYYNVIVKWLNDNGFSRSNTN